jgi:hypothetical protein
MNATILLRALAVAAVSVALAGTPESSFAQHGGHGGGGGFHGSGGGFHGGGFGSHAGGGFHGGSSGGFRSGGGFGNFHGSGGFSGFRGGRGFGGFNNGGFGGFRGGRGFGGFRGNRFFGGFGGYPFFYGFDFGFWPYWGAYPYWYGYGPWWGPYGYYSPYDYPDYPYDAPPDRYPGHDRRDRDNRCRPDYRHPDNRCNDSSPDTSKPNSENPPPRPSDTLGPESSPERNYVTTNFADYRPAVSNFHSNDRATQTTATTAVASEQFANSTAQQVPSGVRPAVRNAIEALRAMPPDARERQLSSGRYDNFSSEERELLNNALQLLQAE